MSRGPTMAGTGGGIRWLLLRRRRVPGHSSRGWREGSAAPGTPARMALSRQARENPAGMPATTQASASTHRTGWPGKPDPRIPSAPVATRHVRHAGAVPDDVAQAVPDGPGTIAQTIPAQGATEDGGMGAVATGPFGGNPFGGNPFGGDPHGSGRYGNASPDGMRAHGFANGWVPMAQDHGPVRSGHHHQGSGHDHAPQHHSSHHAPQHHGADAGHAHAPSHDGGHHAMPDATPSFDAGSVSVHH